MSSDTSATAPATYGQPFSTMTFPTVAGAPGPVSERSHAAGYAAGYAAGMREAGVEAAQQAARADAERRQAAADGQGRIDRAVAALNAAAAAITARTLPLVADAQHCLAEAALELAETVIGVELADEETSARSAVHRALADVDGDLVQRVRLNPEDLAVLQDGDIDALNGLRLVADETLEPGDAITELPDGYLDARITTALARARAALLAAGDGASADTAPAGFDPTDLEGFR